MFPTTAASLLREDYGHDALHVFEVGLRSADDAVAAATARSEGRAIVTENVADFAGERDVVLVFVLKKNLSASGALPKALAKLLDAWAKTNPRPYIGAHWPSRGRRPRQGRRVGDQAGGVNSPAGEPHDPSSPRSAAASRRRWFSARTRSTSDWMYSSS